MAGALKTVATRAINRLRHAPGVRFWQRGNYDRVIRNRRELDAVRRYIWDNPARWAANRENLDELLARMHYAG